MGAKIRILIAGIDGYLGWSLAQYMMARGHEVSGIDNGNRRKWVKEIGACSITPIMSMARRGEIFPIHFINLKNYNYVVDALNYIKPDCIVHLAEMPSAPFSMIDAKHARLTHRNNLEGTINILWAMKEVCPKTHLLKLGTMGEYGTPNLDIPEGMFEVEYRGRKDTLPFPRQAGSFYHQTKVHDSNNIMLACKIWGLCSTDIMQGVVFGVTIPEMSGNPELYTRFDIDECFGTAINRFCACAIVGHPLTIFGVGHQRRGFLPLKDSMQCLTLAAENPPSNGEYRTLNQFEQVYDITDLALMVKRVCSRMGIKARVLKYENPRMEQEEHYYNPDRQKLLELGYQPTHDIESEIEQMIGDLLPFRDTIEKLKYKLIPEIHWDGRHMKCVEL